jgi:hypothetical protein
MSAELLKILIDVVTGNSLTQLLVVGGVICVAIALIGKISTAIDITGVRAFLLGVFGVGLIFVAIAISWILASEQLAKNAVALTPTSVNSIATPLLNATPTTQAMVLPTANSQVVNVTPFCPFVTQAQIEELKKVQTVDGAFTKISEFSSNRMFWNAGDTVPANVVIATDFSTANYQKWDVIPINNSGGWGLFLTTREITTPNPGAYWCVQ